MLFEWLHSMGFHGFLLDVSKRTYLVTLMRLGNLMRKLSNYPTRKVMLNLVWHFSFETILERLVRQMA